jgi:hypothetical protein
MKRSFRESATPPELLSDLAKLPALFITFRPTPTQPDDEERDEPVKGDGVALEDG